MFSHLSGCIDSVYERDNTLQGDLYSVPCPERFQVTVPAYLFFISHPEYRRQGDTFGSLYRTLVSEDHSIPVALYRHPVSAKSELPYVYTCPRPDAVLHPLDQILLLSRTPRTNLARDFSEVNLDQVRFNPDFQKKPCGITDLECRVIPHFGIIWMIWMKRPCVH